MKTKFSIYIDPGLARKIKAKAAEAGKDMGEFCEPILRRAVE